MPTPVLSNTADLDTAGIVSVDSEPAAVKTRITKQTNKQARKAPCPHARSLRTSTFHLAVGVTRVTGGRSSGEAGGEGISSYLHLKEVNCMIIIVLYLNKKKRPCEMYSKILLCSNSSTDSAPSSRD